MKTLLPPGPKGQFILGSAIDMHRDMIGALSKYSKQYGDFWSFSIFSIKCCVVNHPDLIETVLLKKQKSFIKGWDLRQLRFLLGKGLLTNDGKDWLKQRRLAQPAFHSQRIQTYGKIMTSHAQDMLEKWPDNTNVDIHEEMMDVTLKIVSEALFSTDVLGKTEDITKTLDLGMQQFEKMITGLVPIPLAFPTPGNLKLKKAMDKFDEFIYGAIEKRQNNAMQEDLLSMFLQARYEDGTEMPKKQIRDEVITLLLAGHETTAIGMSWTFYLLGQNPEILKELIAEIDTVLEGREPEASDLEKLSFVDAVIKESMRLYPPAWGVGREAIEPVEIGDYCIPKGTQVFILQYIVHRDPRFYENPDDFLPQRWTPEFQKNLPKHAYLPFSRGPRICIGNNFAILEMVLLLTKILQQYTFELDHGHQIETQASVTLRPKNGVRVILHKR